MKMNKTDIICPLQFLITDYITDNNGGQQCLRKKTNNQLNAIRSNKCTLNRTVRLARTRIAKKNKTKKHVEGGIMTDRQFIERLLDIMEVNALADWITNDPYDEFEALRVMIEDHLKRT